MRGRVQKSECPKWGFPKNLDHFFIGTWLYKWKCPRQFYTPPPILLIIYNFKSQDGNYNVYYNTIVSWVYYNTVNEVQYNTVPGDQAGLQAGLQRTSGALKSPDPGFKPEMSGSRFQTWNVRIQVSNLEIYGRGYNIILINRWPCNRTDWRVIPPPYLGLKFLTHNEWN